jgi:hypothetical protein
MIQAAGPQQFVSRFENIAENLFQQILTRAIRESGSTFNVDISVQSDVQPHLQQKLSNARFGKAVFHLGERDGDWVQINGNPHAHQNAAQTTEHYLLIINKMLNTATMSGGQVTLDISIPPVIIEEVRKAYLNAGWKTVEFQHNGRTSEEWMVLSV